MPDFALEHAAGATAGRIVAGVDEVGRGPWAGPVVTAACILDPHRLPPDFLAGLDDSKALSAKRRAVLAAGLRRLAREGSGVVFALRAAPVAEIDRDNILAASLAAMRRAILALPVRPDMALIDGNRLPAGLPCPAQAVVRGDSRSLSIAAASILAKTLRDHLMARLALRHPAYAWERNAGYGTAAHRAGLATAGVSPHHRRSFAPVAALLAHTRS